MASGLPAGPDIGVESAGFIPVEGADAAFVADRGGQADPHSGTDSLLRLTHDVLSTVGDRPGDLLVATEGGGSVVRVRCASECVADLVATGPPTAHVEGRVLVVSGAQFRQAIRAAPSAPSRDSQGRTALTVTTLATVALVGAGVFPVPPYSLTRVTIRGSNRAADQPRGRSFPTSPTARLAHSGPPDADSFPAA